MLYDKRWDKKVAADAYTLPNLVAWLERQPSGQTYNAKDPGVCLLGQFARAMGSGCPGTTSSKLEFLPGWDDVAFGVGAEEESWTFGAALERARQLQSRR